LCCIIAACRLYVRHAMRRSSKSVTSRFLSEHMFPMRSASEDSEPAYHCAATCGRPVMPSASGCSNMLPCTQCLQWSSKHHHLNATHTCTHCWFDCFGIPANVVAVFTAAHMKPRAPCKATLPTPAHVAHYMNSTRHAAHRHTHTNTCLHVC
jgi:hypothetical protein